MEIRTGNIIIDTSYFVQNVFDFNKTELQKLSKLIDNDSAKLYLNDITVAKVHKKISELISTTWKRLDKYNLLYGSINSVKTSWHFL